MPQNVRNFWIELEVDGRKSKIATGPRARDGKFEVSISMRGEDGSIIKDAVGFQSHVAIDARDNSKRFLAVDFLINNHIVTTINNADPMEVTQH